MNPKVDFFFNKDSQWQKEYEQLRKIVLECGLAEELKWGCPCYTYNGANVVLIHGFKEYCAYLFHKGALLADPQSILIQQTENVQSARHIRFTGVKEIVKLAPTLREYIYEAIEVEKAGLKVELKKTKEYPVPDELQAMFDKDPEFKAAFMALTPGRQRGYLLHFAQPKQAKTRFSRIEKCRPKIYEGKGYND